MKKTINEKGITLVALIITVVVLLILAGVAISSINDTGIIAKTKQAGNNFAQAQKDENELLKEYLNKMNIDGEVEEDDNENSEPQVTTMTFYVDGVPFRAESTTGEFYMGKFEYTDTTITKIGNSGGTIEFIGDIGYPILYVVNGTTYNLYYQNGSIVYQGDSIVENYTIKLQS